MEKELYEQILYHFKIPELVWWKYHKKAKYWESKPENPNNGDIFIQYDCSRHEHVIYLYYNKWIDLNKKLNINLYF